MTQTLKVPEATAKVYEALNRLRKERQGDIEKLAFHQQQTELLTRHIRSIDTEIASLESLFADVPDEDATDTTANPD